MQFAGPLVGALLIAGAVILIWWAHRPIGLATLAAVVVVPVFYFIGEVITEQAYC
jgi:hypothetical protein